MAAQGIELFLTESSYLPSSSGELHKRCPLLPGVLRMFVQMSGGDSNTFVNLGAIETLATMGLFAPGLPEGEQNTVESILAAVRTNQVGFLDTFAFNLSQAWDDMGKSL